MTKNTDTEVDENDDETTGDYVTRGELSDLLDEKLEQIVTRLTGDSLPDTETTEEMDEVVGTMSPAAIEKLVEQKMAAAMKTLETKKAARTPTKKVAPKVVTPEPEETPTQPNKKTWAERMWGAK